MTDLVGPGGVPFADYHENRYATLLDRIITRKMRWLDLGAGSRIHGAWVGPDPAELASRTSMLVGTDRLGSHLRDNPDLSAAVVSDGGALPFRDRSFDLVTANMVVEHLEKPQTVFNEVARLLALRGLFVISTPNLRNPIVWLSSWLLGASLRRVTSFLIEHRDLDHIFLTYYRCNTQAQIELMAQRSGFLPQEFHCFSSLPFSKEYPSVAVVEGALIKLLHMRKFRAAQSNLLVILQRCG